MRRLVRPVLLAMMSFFVASFAVAYHNRDEEESFICIIECMDGRCVKPTMEYADLHYPGAFPDTITEAGPNKILAENKDVALVGSIRKRLEISVHHHRSPAILLSAHPECKGNPASRKVQIEQLREARKTIESFGLKTPIVLLWVDRVEKKWKVTEKVE